MISNKSIQPLREKIRPSSRKRISSSRSSMNNSWKVKISNSLVKCLQAKSQLMFTSRPSTTKVSTSINRILIKVSVSHDFIKLTLMVTFLDLDE